MTKGGKGGAKGGKGAVSAKGGKPAAEGDDQAGQETPPPSALLIEVNTKIPPQLLWHDDSWGLFN